MKMLVPVLLLLIARVSFTNGGPIETSPVFGSGDAGPVEFVRRNVQILSEELVLSPGMNYVKVDVTYVLQNTGDDLETGYGFPVEAASKPCEDWYEDSFNEEQDVRDFTILQDGMELPVTYGQIESEGSFFTDYGWDIPVSSYLYTTELFLAAGEITTVEVSYSVRGTYEDFQTTKDFFPGYQDRRFIYDLSPASWWGDGTVDQYTLILNLAELDNLGGTMMDIPSNGLWETELLYVDRREDFNLSTAEPVYFAWETRDACLSAYIEQNTLSPDDYTITVSSQLAGNYGSENLTDGNLNTCWCEGEEGITGSSIEISFEPDVSFAWIGIVPGYAKDSSTYYANARAAQVRAHDPEEYDINDHINDLPDVPWEEIDSGMAWNAFSTVYNRGESFHRDALVITFEEAYPGTEYEDLCISELVVCGW